MAPTIIANIEYLELEFSCVRVDNGNFECQIFHVRDFRIVVAIAVCDIDTEPPRRYSNQRCAISTWKMI